MTNTESYLQDALSHKSEMTKWEKEFVENLFNMGYSARKKLTSKQFSTLRDIAKKYDLVEKHAKENTPEDKAFIEYQKMTGFLK
jgi:polyhydroxyalkanoate synthesis regulator phasin